MTDPKRWSSPGSEVDPVLRSLLVHAREQRPTTRELQAILRGASQAATPSKRRFVALARGVALGLSLAGAGYAAGTLWQPSPARFPAMKPSAAPSATPRRHELGDVTPSSRAARKEAPLATKPSASPTPLRVASSAARASVAADAERDAALLQDARRVMLADPARALGLTRDHELSFPTSALTEERQALRVEALARLGRSAEAERELERFEQRFPRSIYRRRLQSLLPR